MIQEKSLEHVLDGLLDDGAFPNRDHVKRLIAAPYYDFTGEEGIRVTVVTDETLGTDAFASPMTVRIRDAIADRFREHGFEEWVSTRYLTETEFRDQADEDE